MNSNYQRVKNVRQKITRRREKLRKLHRELAALYVEQQALRRELGDAEFYKLYLRGGKA